MGRPRQPRNYITRHLRVYRPLDMAMRAAALTERRGYNDLVLVVFEDWLRAHRYLKGELPARRAKLRDVRARRVMRRVVRVKRNALAARRVPPMDFTLTPLPAALPDAIEPEARRLEAPPRVRKRHGG